MIKVRKPEIKQNKIHLENEEKPIVEPLMKVSEDFHGGDEVTQSVDDQRFALQQASQEQQNETQEREQSKTEKEEAHEEEQEQKENTEEGENGEEHEGQQEQNGNTEQAKGQEQKGQKENEETEQNGEQNEEKTEQEEQEESEEENEQTEENEEEQTEEKQENTEQAFKLTGTKGKIFLELYRLIEYLQEEERQLTPEPVSQTQALNLKKLLFRQYERKSITSYYYYKQRSQAILVLDNSGSMQWLQEVLDTFFAVALKRKDVQVFIAPNGVIEDEYNEKTKKFQEISHEEAMRTIVQTGLPVLYIGDFDGANTPIELSWTNQVYWICTETRYKYFSEHDWVSYNEEQFKGFFGRAWNAEEIVLVIKEFAKHIQQSYFWYDKHKEDEYDNEE